MKFLLLFFLSSFTAYSQVKEHFYNEFGLPIDSLILGDWELEKVEIVNGYYEIEDSNRFVSNSLQNHTLSIFADSIVILPDLSSRYYRRNKVFEYLINQPEYRKNPVLQLQEVNKFKPRTRKRSNKFFHYEIISCKDEKLVLLYSSFVDDGLASPTVSHLYTYKKPTKSTSIDSLITGVKWYFCSDTNQNFLSENETQTFEFQKVDTNNLIECPKHEINIEFLQSENSKELACSSSTRKFFVIDGLIYRNSKYRIDTQNKLLYLLNTDVYVYNILLVNENQLTLVLNKSLTDKLNQRMK
jgi:YHS domain-containing protein